MIDEQQPAPAEGDGAESQTQTQTRPIQDPASPIPFVMHGPEGATRIALKGYRIDHTLGAGTMGTVYQAEQLSTGRVVALKLLKAGEDAPDRVKRFLLEAQVLAQLSHPYIAALYETGSFETEEGRPQPFIAMEYIEGKMLNKHAVESGLTIRQRVELFIKVCEGVHYAHLRGVIHRDLKPGNILVNTAGEPKILDFGLARVTNSDIEVVTMHTAIGQILGSLNYMSPEQAMGIPERVDMRADVYALGVILYALLGGQLPLDLKKKSLYEAVKIIQTEVPKPLGDLLKTYRGGLEEIVARALSKDRKERQQTAFELAEDLRNHLAG